MSGTLLDLGNILVDETVPVSVIMHLSRKNYSPKWSEYSVDRQLMFFKNLLIFNRKIIGLQYCVGFCHTSTWWSHRYGYVLSLLNFPPTSHPFHPSRLSQSPSWSSLSDTTNSHWLSILHRVVYVFSCYSLHSHPCILKPYSSFITLIIFL